VKAIMKTHAAFLSLAVPLALASAQARAYPNVSTSGPSYHAGAELSRPVPRALAAAGSPAERHLFPVRDQKGLLLSCVAPEMEINSETDVFKNCTLAPGRTLDELMHSFIKAIHQEEKEQSEKQADRVLPEKTAEKKPDEKAAQR
jgi:hypothetical protein